MELNEEIIRQYDSIADVYDTLFTDESSVRENSFIAERLSKMEGSVYDIGCGTGLLLDLVSIEPALYKGCDPSKRMVERFKKNHAAYADRVVCIPFEKSDDFQQYDNVVSIFGSISYVRKRSLKLLAETDCKKFLMFYKPDYVPLTYKKTNVDFKHYIYDKDRLAAMFEDCTREEFNNFIIVSNL